MAKNKGIFKVQGKLDGYVFYRRNGKDIVQMAGGFDGERIKTEERYEKTRQLAGEFGHCASLASLLKRELAPFLATIPDPYVYNWIQQRLTMIKECDTDSPKGSKTVGKGLATAEGRRLLEGFSFNRHKGLGAVLYAPYDFNPEEGVFRISDFCPVRDFCFVKGVGVGGMQLVLLRVNFESGTCEQISSDLLVFEKDDVKKEVVFRAAIPVGEGVLMGLLFVGNGEIVNDEMRWFKNEGNVVEILRVL
jgi:hypothetical protein